MKHNHNHDNAPGPHMVPVYFEFTHPTAASRFTKKAAPLTSREMEVLQLIAEGKANKETANELGIGIKTVEKHREHVMQKLDIHDTARSGDSGWMRS